MSEATETSAVQVFVSELRPVRGRGNIRFELTAAVEICGVEVILHNLTLRAEPHGRLGCYLPQCRRGDGVWHRAISLPAAVERAIAAAALEQAGGMVVASPIEVD